MKIEIRASFKRFFFDRPAVQRLADRRSVDMLGELGAFVRKAGRSLLRKRKRASRPGEIPSVHTDDPVATLRNIQFAYDPAMNSVVIGPLALNQVGFTAPTDSNDREVLSGDYLRPKRGVVPRVMEHGGMVAIREQQIDGEWKRIPFGKRVAAERRIPIWLATPEEIRQQIRREVVRVAKRGITYIIVGGSKAIRTRWVNIAARPFMQPAAIKGLAEWRVKSRFLQRKAA